MPHIRCNNLFINGHRIECMCSFVFYITCGFNVCHLQMMGVATLENKTNQSKELVHQDSLDENTQVGIAIDASLLHKFINS